MYLTQSLGNILMKAKWVERDREDVKVWLEKNGIPGRAKSVSKSCLMSKNTTHSLSVSKTPSCCSHLTEESTHINLKPFKL